jgi:arsenate reductase (glutaredoxin)
MIVFGIKNCDSVQKAVKWFNKENIPFQFHDFKEQGVTIEKLAGWCKQSGWETVLNKKSTTWRLLEKKAQEAISSEAKAIAFMQKNTSSIKRPVIEVNGKLVVQGFNEARYRQLFFK